MDSFNKAVTYSTPREQIEMLKAKHLLIKNEDLAVQQLTSYGYYNIINGYKEPYIYATENGKFFKDGVSFEQIFSLYLFDHNIRNSIMAAMLDLEESMRTDISDTIAENISTDHNEYLKKIHYQDRSSKFERFSTDGILRSLTDASASGKDPIKYYRDKYGIIPPWILLKGTYFSTLINYFKILKPNEKSDVIQRSFGFNKSNSSLKCVKNFFLDSLFVCLDFRNRAAHGGRIYSFDSSHDKNIECNHEFYACFPAYSEIKELSGITRLDAILTLFQVSDASGILYTAVNEQLARHLETYPQDKEVLESVIHGVIDINP